MGIVFGMTGVEEPKFTLLPSSLGAAGELRMYPQYVVAEILKPIDDNQGFNVLAKYIGVFGDPANEGKKALAMTAPVTLTPAPATKLAMTAPVLTTPSSTTGYEYMGFVLPFDITRAEDAPRPIDKRVTLRTVPPRLVACRSFSGWYSSETARSHFTTLNEALVKEGLNDDASANLPFEVSQYHPPFTLPFFRRNEVWLELRQSLPAVKKILEAAAKVKG